MTELVDERQETMLAKRVSRPIVEKYLNNLFDGKNVTQIVQMLTKPVSLDLVQAAVELLNSASAPGTDGVQLSVYKMFSEFFGPIMLNIYNQMFSSHSLNPRWSIALLNPILKGLGTALVQNL